MAREHVLPRPGANRRALDANRRRKLVNPQVLALDMLVKNWMHIYTVSLRDASDGESKVVTTQIYPALILHMPQFREQCVEHRIPA